jgi:hypothetical protein
MPHHQNEEPLLKINEGGSYSLHYVTVNERSGDNLGVTYLVGSLETIITKLVVAHRSALQMAARTTHRLLKERAERANPGQEIPIASQGEKRNGN